ncbi:hypothetical protein [Macrococcus bovicus]|uniref:Oligosaccharide repeat unit polymerase n=1 Tax=Macrococcus bovicus TaxID=69968 RepID=A0A4R6C1N7_9STAP|nr:hypothetical protein [Macrococcus bovicus]TDM14916.1 hypothetical protein ERX55_02960 [Macrococcus bovicus]
MGMELIVVLISYIILLRKKDFDIYKVDFRFRHISPALNQVFVIFIIISILLSPLIIDHITFLGIGEQKKLNELSITQTIIFFMLYLSKFLLIGQTINFFYIKYNQKPLNRYLLITIILVLVINSIFIGLNRMDVVLAISSALIILNNLYKKKMKVYNYLIFTFLLISLYIISLGRATFSYQITSNKLALLTDYLQIYFAGIYNVALSLDISIYIKQNVYITFLYDVIRPFLGLNMLWRPETLLTSTELFNQRIFENNQVSQIIPLLGQFYLPFELLSVFIYPILIMLIIRYFLQKVFDNNLTYSMILIVIVLRAIITIFQNLSIFINELSSLIILLSSIVLFKNLLLKVSNK